MPTLKKNVAGYVDEQGRFRPIRSPQYIGKRAATAKDRRKYSKALGGDLGEEKRAAALADKWEDPWVKEARIEKQERDRIEREIAGDIYGGAGVKGKGRTLLQFVRDEGGVKRQFRHGGKKAFGKRSEWDKGEIDRLSYKETGKRGLTSETRGKTPDKMYQAALAAGYDVSSISDLMDRVENEAAGRGPTYATRGFMNYTENPKKPKYKIGDRVYSYWNKTSAGSIGQMQYDDNGNFWKYAVNHPTLGRRWINETSLAKSKNAKAVKNPDVDWGVRVCAECGKYTASRDLKKLGAVNVCKACHKTLSARTAAKRQASLFDDQGSLFNPNKLVCDAKGCKIKAPYRIGKNDYCTKHAKALLKGDTEAMRYYKTNPPGQQVRHTSVQIAKMRALGKRRPHLSGDLYWKNKAAADKILASKYFTIASLRALNDAYTDAALDEAKRLGQVWNPKKKRPPVQRAAKRAARGAKAAISIFDADGDRDLDRKDVAKLKALAKKNPERCLRCRKMTSEGTFDSNGGYCKRCFEERPKSKRGARTTSRVPAGHSIENDWGRWIVRNKKTQKGIGSGSTRAIAIQSARVHLQSAKKNPDGVTMFAQLMSGAVSAMQLNEMLKPKKRRAAKRRKNPDPVVGSQKSVASRQKTPTTGYRLPATGSKPNPKRRVVSRKPNTDESYYLMPFTDGVYLSHGTTLGRRFATAAAARKFAAANKIKINPKPNGLMHDRFKWSASARPKFGGMAFRRMGETRAKAIAAVKAAVKDHGRKLSDFIFEAELENPAPKTAAVGGRRSAIGKKANPKMTGYELDNFRGQVRGMTRAQLLELIAAAKRGASIFRKDKAQYEQKQGIAQRELAKRNPAAKKTVAAKKRVNPRFKKAVSAQDREIFEARKRVAASRHARGFSVYNLLTRYENESHVPTHKAAFHKLRLKYAKENPPKPPRSRTFEQFQGRPVTQAKPFVTSRHAPARIVQLGDLVELKIAGMPALKFNPDRVKLCAANGKLWIAGKRFAKANPAAGVREINPIGEIDHVVYRTFKPHHGDPPGQHYIHKLGEDSGRRPLLCVDKDGFPVVRGGNYKIEARGIVD